jgi:putative transposase
MVPGVPYPADMSDAEGELTAALDPAPKNGGRPPVHERREIINAPAYWVRARCAWRRLTHDLPPSHTIYNSWRRKFDTPMSMIRPRG